MCLTINKTFKTRKEAREFTKNPKIAEKDIRVYKVLTQDNYSPHFPMKYEKGFHYKEEKFSFEICRWYDIWGVSINKGLHSAKNIRKANFRVNCGYGDKIVIMYIPKGAKYFESNGEYVSTELVWY